MKYGSFNFHNKRAAQFIVAFALLLVSFGSGGCAFPPRLTAEDRRSDVEYLAQWARDYHPCVEVNSRVGGMPDYEKLLPKYMDLAEQAETNEEFLAVLWGYHTLIGATGHGYLVSDGELQGYKFDSWRTGAKGFTDMPWWQFEAARYWVRLYERSLAHAPFRIIREGGEYFTGEDWSYRGIRIPAGSQIVAVNGMSCSDYKDYLKRQTSLRYVAGNADRFTEPLLVMNEGSGFKGWDVSFRLPNGKTCGSFVPRREGGRSHANSMFRGLPGGNCECVELSDEVGYVRVKYMNQASQESDEENIRSFLEESQGRYKKLIVDCRHNTGGSNLYTYDTLIRPFLDEPLVYKQVSGVKRRFREDLWVVRGSCSVDAWETAVDEVPPPSGFDPNQWIFYEISRKVEPSDRYAFDGDMYVLMDRRCCSAAETYLDGVKRTSLATLVGQRSVGALGGYFIAPVMRLPESGIIFRMEGDLDINPDGTFIELTGVQPDVELPPCPLPDRVDREALLEDPWIQAIINGLNGPKQTSLRSTGRNGNSE